MSQQRPPAQEPEAQSLPVRQARPVAQRVAHAAAGPPQSMDVSKPSCAASSHWSVPPQPSGTGPQVAPASAHVRGVQPQARGVPPPPQVAGVVHSGSEVQAHWPAPSHWAPWPQEVPAATGAWDGTPAEQEPVRHSVLVGTSASSWTGTA